MLETNLKIASCTMKPTSASDAPFERVENRQEPVQSRHTVVILIRRDEIYSGKKSRNMLETNLKIASCTIKPTSASDAPFERVESRQEPVHSRHTVVIRNRNDEFYKREW